MIKKPFNHLSYADLFPLVKKFFKKNTKWHPLTGDLPFDFLSQRPDALDMRCVELILKARGLWGVLSWNKDDPDLSMTQVLFDCVPNILSRSATAAGKILGQLGPDQIPESHLLEEARQEAEPTEAYKIFSVLSIYFAWNALKKIFLGEQHTDDPEPPRQALLAEVFLNKAERRWLYEVQRKSEMSERGRKGRNARKKPPEFDLLVNYTWQKSKKKTCLSMWEFLIRELAAFDIGGRNIIDGCDFVYEKKTNKITLYFEDEKRRPKEIGFRSFERRVSDLKKDLKNITTK